MAAYLFAMCLRLAPVILVLTATSAVADPPPDAVPLDAVAALDCVAARYRGEPLRIEADEDGLVQDLRWLTPGGNVLDIELTGPGCRFLQVDGVGQTEARILPGAAP
ncbi:MAG: Cys/Met metabolism pyridoxal-phosphate-dependent enzyme [Rhodobacteraceae bacterium]|nr:Cys/Met metabolism pyridoxal-phosphate-dependent enzyme [Paracoccaceae bacterium]